jgi:hypothetical protein
MLVMRVGILLCGFMATVCLAGQPAASTQTAADSGSANSRQRIVHLVGPRTFLGPHLDSRLDTTRAHDTLFGRWGFPSPFLIRFLPGAGLGAVTYAQWRSGRYLRSVVANNVRFYGNSSEESDELFSYDSRAMQTIGEIAYWVVPPFLPPRAQEALERERDSFPPIGHGWPYHRW